MDCADGYYPGTGLVQGANGDFYGTAEQGGANSFGTVFEITAWGKLTTLYSFCSQSDCVDGSDPFAGLVQATNRNFYGTRSSDGTTGDGTVFSLATGLEPFVEALPTRWERW